MIEVVSYPQDLAVWDSHEQPFYLELFGEVNPLVNTAFAEVQPAGSPDGTPQPTAPAPIYEYWWTIGHHGLAYGDHRGLMYRAEHLGSIGQAHHDLWSNLEETAAHVYLYFPTNLGWRIKEVTATVKYLTPFHEQAHWWDKAAQDLKNLSPLIQAAGDLAKLVPNPASAGASSILSTIAKLQINSVPQVDGFAWAAAKVTHHSQTRGAMQGIAWTLPKKMFLELGGRITGSVAVSFIPARRQRHEPVALDQQENATEPGDELEFKPGSVLAKAVIHFSKQREYGAPPVGEKPEKFISLEIAPKAPPPPKTASPVDKADTPTN